MPKVKQADFDLNAILTELIGTDEDLHREIMNNLIEGNPYVFKITKQPKGWKIGPNDTKWLRTDAVGLGLNYQWQWSSDGINFTNSTMKESKLKEFPLRYVSVSRDYYERCKITDRYGNVLYTDVIIIGRK